MRVGKSGIYFIISKVNGKVYVGSASNLTLRFTVHRYHLRRNKHHCRYLQNVWNKYGEANFEFKIVELCSKEFLQVREQYYLDSISKAKLLNSQLLARTCLGFKHSETTKQKMSLAAKKVSNTLEQKLLRSERAKNQHKQGTLGRKRKDVIATCKNCDKQFIRERHLDGKIKQTKYCVDCRPKEHKGGNYKYERTLWGEGKPKQKYVGR